MPPKRPFNPDRPNPDQETASILPLYANQNNTVWHRRHSRPPQKPQFLRYLSQATQTKS